MRFYLALIVILLTASWSYAANAPGDVNGDGVCDDLDFLEVINNFGKDYRIAYPGPMIYIPAGPFLMGNSGVGNDVLYGRSDEFPQHVVNLSGYWIGKYPVTRGEYKKFIDANGYLNSAYWSTEGWTWKGARTQPPYWTAQQNWGSGTFTQTDNHPVVGVTYYEAEAFCNWAGGHLPTEAQWQKAARWDAAKLHANVYPWGDTWIPNLCNCSEDLLYPGNQTAPVGSYGGDSPYGCKDMAGNVDEWRKDWYQDNYYSVSPTNDPQGPTSGTARIVAGGGWNDWDRWCRTAVRWNYSPDVVDSTMGFRIAH